MTDKEGGNPFLHTHLKIAELTTALAELKGALVEAKSEAKEKEEEVKLLEANFLKSSPRATPASRHAQGLHRRGHWV